MQDKEPSGKRLKIKPRIVQRAKEDDAPEAEKPERLLDKIEEARNHRRKPFGEHPSDVLESTVRRERFKREPDERVGRAQSEGSASEHPDVPLEELGTVDHATPERRKRGSSGSFRRTVLRVGRIVLSHRVPTLPVVIVVSILFWVVTKRVHESGIRTGIVQANAAASKERERLTPEQLAELNAALALVWDGAPAEAIAPLMDFQARHPGVASLNYMVGLAALQANNNQLAKEAIGKSIVKRERLSDALALDAIFESKKIGDPAMRTMGDARIRSEDQLRRAIAVDPANPHPMILLGTLLNDLGRKDEARTMLEGARVRLQPLDSLVVLEGSLAMLDLSEKTDAELPAANPNAEEPVEIFSSALIAFRKDQPDLAVTLLERARDQMPKGLFRYLLRDPSLRIHLADPGIRSRLDQSKAGKPGS